jgi:hypothetical protein
MCFVRFLRLFVADALPFHILQLLVSLTLRGWLCVSVFALILKLGSVG